MDKKQIQNFEKYLKEQIAKSKELAGKYKDLKTTSKMFRRDAEVFESALISFQFIKSV